MHRLLVVVFLAMAVLCTTGCSTTSSLAAYENPRGDEWFSNSQFANAPLTQSQDGGDGVFLGVRCRLFKYETREESDQRKLELLRSSSKCRLRFVGLHWPSL